MTLVVSLGGGAVGSRGVRYTAWMVTPGVNLGVTCWRGAGGGGVRRRL